MSHFVNRVVPPFGADHLLAIATSDEPSDLRASIDRLGSQAGAMDLLLMLQSKISKKPYAIGIAAIYTDLSMSRSLHAAGANAGSH